MLHNLPQTARYELKVNSLKVKLNLIFKGNWVIGAANWCSHFSECAFQTLGVCDIKGLSRKKTWIYKLTRLHSLKPMIQNCLTQFYMQMWFSNLKTAKLTGPGQVNHSMFLIQPKICNWMHGFPSLEKDGICAGTRMAWKWNCCILLGRAHELLIAVWLAETQKEKTSRLLPVRKNFCWDLQCPTYPKETSSSPKFPPASWLHRLGI